MVSKCRASDRRRGVMSYGRLRVRTTKRPIDVTAWCRTNVFGFPERHPISKSQAFVRRRSVLSPFSFKTRAFVRHRSVVLNGRRLALKNRRFCVLKKHYDFRRLASCVLCTTRNRMPSIRHYAPASRVL